MSCDHVQELISPLLDRRLGAGERENVLAHLEACRECDEHLEAIQNQRKALLSMASPPAPADLNARLRVMGGAAVLLAFSCLMPLLPGLAFPLLAASMFALAHMAWMTNSTTLPVVSARLLIVRCCFTNAQTAPR